MRVVIALLLSLHGFAHLVGFATSWGLAETPDRVQANSILGTRVELGETGGRVYGIGWLCITLAFLCSAFLLIQNQPSWFAVASAALSISAVFCILSWPLTQIGMLLNVVLAVWIFAGVSQGWLPGGKH